MNFLSVTYELLTKPEKVAVIIVGILFVCIVYMCFRAVQGLFVGPNLNKRPTRLTHKKDLYGKE